MTERHRLMKAFAAKAKEREAANDSVLRTQAADDWRDLATDAEARRAPKYLWWFGRKA